MHTIYIIIIVLAILGLPIGMVLYWALNVLDEAEQQAQFGDEPLTDGTIRYEGNKRSRTKDINV